MLDLSADFNNTNRQVSQYTDVATRRATSAAITTPAYDEVWSEIRFEVELLGDLATEGPFNQVLSQAVGSVFGSFNKLGKDP